MNPKTRIEGRRPGLLALALPVALALAFGPPAAAQDIAGTLALCATCHGEDGRPSEPDTPIIWGQEFYYLYVQLKDYKAGRRQHQIMSEIVADLEKEELQALAQHFSERDWPSVRHETSEADARQGATVAVAGQCPQCHLDRYLGDSRIPRLAGQQPAYLKRTMLELKTKQRQNAAAIAAIMSDFSEQEIAAMAQYLAGL